MALKIRPPYKKGHNKADYKVSEGHRYKIKERMYIWL